MSTGWVRCSSLSPAPSYSCERQAGHTGKHREVSVLCKKCGLPWAAHPPGHKIGKDGELDHPFEMKILSEWG